MNPSVKYKDKIGERVWMYQRGIHSPREVLILGITKDSDDYSTDYYFEVLDDLNIKHLKNIIFETEESCQKYIDVITYNRTGMIEI
jgi:hypothetical protein